MSGQGLEGLTDGGEVSRRAGAQQCTVLGGRHPGHQPRCDPPGFEILGRRVDPTVAVDERTRNAAAHHQRAAIRGGGHESLRRRQCQFRGAGVRVHVKKVDQIRRERAAQQRRRRRELGGARRPVRHLDQQVERGARARAGAAKHGGFEDVGEVDGGGRRRGHGVRVAHGPHGSRGRGPAPRGGVSPGACSTAPPDLGGGCSSGTRADSPGPVSGSVAVASPSTTVVPGVPVRVMDAPLSSRAEGAARTLTALERLLVWGGRGRTDIALRPGAMNERHEATALQRLAYDAGLIEALDGMAGRAEAAPARTAQPPAGRVPRTRTATRTDVPAVIDRTVRAVSNERRPSPVPRTSVHRGEVCRTVCRPCPQTTDET
jgi:hypothetical protein